MAALFHPRQKLSPCSPFSGRTAFFLFPSAVAAARQHHQPQKLKHDKQGLHFHEYTCSYDPNAAEPALNDENRNIIAAAMPELPARLQIVYGNKWVDGRFNAFLKTRLSVYLIDTDYVPAFLATPLEVCLYLFLMDYCIIKENYTKVKDEDLKQFLHIFKASPMLRIKKLL